MKTIKEWFQELPEPYREQVLNNTPENMLEVVKPTLRSCIVVAFCWGDSPEGALYWYQLWHDLTFKIDI